jgi:hypothetical protein
VIKAFKKGDAWLADRIYSGVPAGDFGFHQTIRIGPMSGKSNVIFWLESHGLEPTEERVERIFGRGESVESSPRGRRDPGSLRMTASFRQFGLREELQRALDEAGYTTPTPIQEKAFRSCSTVTISWESPRPARGKPSPTCSHPAGLPVGR